MQKKKLKILYLLHKALVPPMEAKAKDLDAAEWRVEYYVLQALKNLGHEIQMIPLDEELSPIRIAAFEFKPDIAFNLLEEFQGLATYDANVVSYLELLKIPYTGCNPRGLILARDKALTKKILTYHNIPVPEFFTVKRGQKTRKPTEMKFPVIVKSLFEEASLGISQSSVVYDDKTLEERVTYMHEKIQTDAIVEEYIEGREIYVGVVGNDRVQVLSPTEMHFEKMNDSSHAIATRRAKWDEKYRKKNGISSGLAKDLSPEILSRIEKVCKDAYLALNLNSYARMDLRLKADGVAYVIEANPNPSIAPDDDFIISAREKIGTYEEVLQRLLDLGMKWGKDTP